MTWETDLGNLDNNEGPSPRKRQKTLPGPDAIRWVGVALPGKRKARWLPFLDGEPNIVSNVLEHFKVPMGHHLWLRGQDITLRFFDTPQELGLNDGDTLVCTTSGRPWVSVRVTIVLPNGGGGGDTTAPPPPPPPPPSRTIVRVSFDAWDPHFVDVLHRSVCEQLVPGVASTRVRTLFCTKDATTPTPLRRGVSAYDIGIACGDMVICAIKPQRQAPTSCPVLRQRVTFAPTHVQDDHDHITKDMRSVYDKPPAVSLKRLRDYKKTFEGGGGGGVAAVRLRQEVQGRYPKGGASLVVALFRQVGVSNTPCMLEAMVPFYDGKDMTANTVCADRIRQDALAEAVGQGWVRTRGCGAMAQLTEETHHMLMFMC